VNEEMAVGAMPSNRDVRIPEQPCNPVGIGSDVRNIAINKVLNGYVVTCGCKLVVFTSKDVMLSEIGRYFDNPQQVEKEYMSKK
jgi:hypothetical protein